MELLSPLQSEQTDDDVCGLWACHLSVDLMSVMRVRLILTSNSPQKILNYSFNILKEYFKTSSHPIVSTGPTHIVVYLAQSKPSSQLHQLILDLVLLEKLENVINARLLVPYRSSLRWRRGNFWGNCRPHYHELVLVGKSLIDAPRPLSCGITGFLKVSHLIWWLHNSALRNSTEGGRPLLITWN